MLPSVVTTISRHKAVASLVEEHCRQLFAAAPAAAPRAALIYAPVGIDVGALARSMSEHSQVPTVLGCTSYHGAMSEASGSLQSTKSDACVVMWLLAGEASAACVTFTSGSDLHAKGRELARKALEKASFAGDRISFAIFHGTPGGEESLLAGLYETLPATVVVVGGSAADNDLSGKWQVFANGDATSSGAVLGLFSWPGKVSCALRGGYLATNKKATVTRASGRILYELDGEPAADVYNRWSGNTLISEILHETPILARTTYHPLGVVRAKVHGTELYVLAHPERSVLPERGLALFAEIKEGEQVTMMHATEKTLIARSAWAASDAMRQESLCPSDLAGALLVYCGGCAMAIESRLPAMIDAMSEVLCDVPFAATYTFGEQGSLVGKRTEHGNLMSSVLLLGRVEQSG